MCCFVRHLRNVYYYNIDKVKAIFLINRLIDNSFISIDKFIVLFNMILCLCVMDLDTEI